MASKMLRTAMPLLAAVVTARAGAILGEDVMALDDDACLAGGQMDEDCALSLRQLRGQQELQKVGSHDHAEGEGVPPAEDAGGADASQDTPGALEAWPTGSKPTGNTTGSPWDDVEPTPLVGVGGGWYQGGDKVWGGGAGIEVVNGGNVGYYDAGMRAAKAHCGDAGCALIVNPAGHRTVNQFHIHFVRYQSYGRNLKHSLESSTCHSEGEWHHGGPCGGKAAFFYGFPGIFSKAMDRSIHHASLIAWPQACGGRGTIIEVAYGCSIEHQIRGDYDPNRR